jgi:chemosensory pili system protein ChpA (sensor histidine kinase/response regulator)
MNIDDLLALLVAEYGAGLDDAKRPLAAFVGTKDSSPVEPEALEATAEFVERSVAAANLISLGGLAKYLSHVGEVVRALPNPQSTAHEALASWASDGLDIAAALIESPTSAAAIELVSQHASQSPLAPPPDWHVELAIELLQPPSIMEDDDEAAQNRFEPITEADVSLDVNDADPELLAAMLADAPQQLERIYRELGEYASGVKSEPGALAESQRIAHTLKGSGNIIGIPGVARIAHRLEDTLIWLDADRVRDQAAQSCALRDAMLASETLQQMVSYLAGDDTAPAYALPVLERMQEWAEHIYRDEADDFTPGPIDFAVASPDAPATAHLSLAEPAPRSESAGPDRSVMRVASERISTMLNRAGQSLANVQRTTQSLRVMDETLLLAQQRQAALKARLVELQQTVDRQVVALQTRRDESAEFDPLEMDRYDALHLLARVVSEAVQDQVDLTNEVRERAQRLVGELRDEQRALREQHRDLLDTRLVPFSSAVPRLRRNVAQTSTMLGKPTRLEIEGADTAVDAEVLSSLTEPLLHLLRNAVDHGIEPTEQRLQAGKPAEACVRLRCAREGQHVRIELSDDGGGLDTEAIAARAREVGLLDGDEALAVSDVHRLILHRGFSTKRDVTDVSGRGIGLDIVNDRIKAMKGHLLIASTPGLGTTFSMRVPVSSGIAQSMIVETGSERVAISSDQIATVLPPGSVAADSSHVHWGGDSVAIVLLSRWIGFSDEAMFDASVKTLVLVQLSEGYVALAVDRVAEVRELVLQDVGGLLRRITGIQTGALLDSGLPLFLLDVSALEMRARSGVAMSAALALQRRAAVSRTRVLVVDDALSARRAVEQVFEDQGYEVYSAGDGFEALEVLRKWDIALVATDLEMPNLNGLELVKRMREVPAWSAIPVAMITSRVGERHRSAALAAGVDEYLVKPFSDRQLAQTAENLLRTRRAAA